MSVDISVQADISPAKSIHIRTMLTIRPMILLRGIQFRVLLIGCIRTEMTVIAIPSRNISKKLSFKMPHPVGINKDNTNTTNNFFKHGQTIHFAPLHHQGGLVGTC